MFREFPPERHRYAIENNWLLNLFQSLDGVDPDRSHPSRYGDFFPRGIDLPAASDPHHHVVGEPVERVLPLPNQLGSVGGQADLRAGLLQQGIGCERHEAANTLRISWRREATSWTPS